jgi:dTDP-4-dehydrorhamnose reductase
MRKVLILGSNGSLGSYLVKHLSKSKKFKIYAQSRKKDNKYYCNFKKNKNFNKLLNDIKPAIVINTIANTNVDLCEKDFKKCFEDNILTSSIISEECGKNKIKIIYISSDQVYSGKGPHKETDASPVNNYGLSKLLGESFALKNNGIVLRVNFLFRHLNNKNFNDEVILSKKKKIKLFKNIYFSPLHISTLTQFISNYLFELKPGIYNVGSNNKISKSNYIKKLCKIVGVKRDFILTNYSNKIVTRPLDMSMNITRVNKFCELNYCIHDEIYKLANEYKNDQNW